MRKNSDIAIRYWADGGLLAYERRGENDLFNLAERPNFFPEWEWILVRIEKFPLTEEQMQELPSKGYLRSKEDPKKKFRVEEVQGLQCKLVSITNEQDYKLVTNQDLMTDFEYVSIFKNPLRLIGNWVNFNRHLAPEDPRVQEALMPSWLF